MGEQIMQLLPFISKTVRHRPLGPYLLMEH